MRTSPTGHASTHQMRKELATIVATAVGADTKTHAEIAYSAGMRTAELDALLAQERLSPEQANTILSGLANPNTRVKVAVGEAPYNTVAPAAPTGTKTVGQTLTAVNGTWDGDATITYTYQWVRYDSATTRNYTAITGATSGTYVLQAGDATKYIGVLVTATNALGASTAQSARTTVVS